MTLRTDGRFSLGAYGAFGGSSRDERKDQGRCQNERTMMIVRKRLQRGRAFHDSTRSSVRTGGRQDRPIRNRELQERGDPCQRAHDQQRLMTYAGDERRRDTRQRGHMRKSIGPDQRNRKLQSTPRVAEPNSRHHCPDSRTDRLRSECVKADGGRNTGAEVARSN